MRRSMLCLPLVVLAVLGTGACAPVSDENSTPELLIWVDATREPAAKLYQESVAGEVDVKIEVVDGAALQSKITLFNTTGSGWPDVVFGSSPNDVAAFQDASNGYALDLTGLVDDSVIDSYDGANDWCLIDGSYYCLKNDLAQTVLWYDATTFDELGLSVPTTMEEWADTALTLNDAGYSSGAVGDENLYASFLWPSECPVSTVTASNTIRIDADAPECTRVSELVQPLLDAGALDSRSSFDAGFLQDVAQAGKVAMTFGPSWFGEFVLRPADSWAVPAGRIAAAPMPIWDGADEAYSGEWGGGIWVASSHSEFKQEAADAITFMATSPEVAKDAPTFPGSKPAYEAWATRISADPYYASDVIPAMVQQASLISTSQNPVRFDTSSGLSAVLAVEINAGAPVDASVRKLLEAFAQLAPGSGYTVVK